MLKLPSWGVPTCFAPWELKGKICISPPVPFHCTGGYNIATPLWGSEMTLSTACAPDGAQRVEKVVFCLFNICVIPAEAGIQTFISQCYAIIWIPASAGMTRVHLFCMFAKTGLVKGMCPSRAWPGHFCTSSEVSVTTMGDGHLCIS